MNSAKKMAAKCAIATASVMAVADTASAQSEAERQNAYFQSGYQYCDARKIAAVWNTDGYGGKLVIGGKVLAGLTHLADADIASTGYSVPCTWRDAGFTYDDAVRLAAFWGESIGDAKTKIIDYASQRGAWQFRRDMSHVLG